MKDEIKEILNLFKNEDVNGFIISDEIYQNLKDYITNLEEKYDYMYDKLTSESTEWESKYYNLQEENERLKVKLENKLTPDELVSMLNQELVRQNKDYKSRNEKAIEKLESIRAFGLRSGKTLFSTLINETIDILQGSDNNE